MARCEYCGSTILFGGTQEGPFRFCNDRCATSAPLVVASRDLPETLVDQQSWAVYQGACPACGGVGPVDVQTSYRVWSALLLTSWSSRPQVACRSCGVKSKLGDALFSVVLGWWGFPWGLIVTPVQVIRNLVGLASSPPNAPSDALRKLVRVHLAAQAMEAGAAPRASAGRG